MAYFGINFSYDFGNPLLILCCTPIKTATINHINVITSGLLIKIYCFYHFGCFFRHVYTPIYQQFIKSRMSVHPHGCLGGAKAHRRTIIVDKAGKLKNLSYPQ